MESERATPIFSEQVQLELVSLTLKTEDSHLEMDRAQPLVDCSDRELKELEMVSALANK